MDSESFQWLSELGVMEDLHPTFSDHDYEVMNSLDDFTAHNGHLQHCAFMSTSSSSQPLMEPSHHHETGKDCQPVKKLKVDSLNSSSDNLPSPPESSSPLNNVAFGHPDSPLLNPHQQQQIAETLLDDLPLMPPGKMSSNKNKALKAGIQGVKRSNSGATTQKPVHCSQDHIMAERKRREKLNLRFIALSAIVPGLKKMDKASVLGEAVRYLKHLEERVKTLEEQTAKKTMESVIFVRKSRVSADDETATSFSDENFISQSNESLPEIEAKVSDKNILIRIHSENQKGILVKVVAEVEKFHLTVTNSSVMQFGDSALDITVLATMEEGFCIEIKDLVRNLRSAVLQFM